MVLRNPLIGKCFFLIKIFMNFPISARIASRELEELYKKGAIEKKIVRRVSKGKDTYYILVTEQ
jgi:DNA-binding HxlR family transcriptional regulator